jgi:hypothetical protein
MTKDVIIAIKSSGNQALTGRIINWSIPVK